MRRLELRRCSTDSALERASPCVKLGAPRIGRLAMVREFQLLTVGFVFLFLGALVLGIF